MSAKEVDLLSISPQSQILLLTRYTFAIGVNTLNQMLRKLEGIACIGSLFSYRVLHCNIRVFYHKRVLTVSTFGVIFFLFSLGSPCPPVFS